MISAVATTNAIALMIAIAHAVSGVLRTRRGRPWRPQDDDREQRQEQAAQLVDDAVQGDARRRRDVRDAPAPDDDPQDAHVPGPNGTLAPMPDRINQDVGPRMIETPGMSAQKTRPLTNHAITPRMVMTAIWLSVSACEGRRHLLVVDVARQDDEEDEDEDPDDESGPQEGRSAARRRSSGGGVVAGSLAARGQARPWSAVASVQHTDWTRSSGPRPRTVRLGLPRRMPPAGRLTG